MRLVWTIALLAAVVAFAGGEAEKKPAERQPEPYSKTFETGPLKVVLQLDRTNLTLDETILLKLEVIAPERFTTTMPKLDEGVEQFRWELEASSAPELDSDGNLHTRRDMRLEPIVIYDKISVKPLAIRFKEKDGKEYEIETEEIEVKVEMPPEEFWQNLDIDRTAAETPVKRLNAAFPRWMLWTAAAIAVCALAAVACVVFKRRRTAVREVPKRPPQEVALDELRALVAEHLVEDGHLMEFYNRIQDILRRYIEARFGLMAPERTTEEFLSELKKSENTALRRHDGLLQSFLNHCDMVRFATYAPEKQEIQATFNSCKEFILATSE